MKEYVFVIPITVLFLFLATPLFINAAVVGEALIYYDNQFQIGTLECIEEPIHLYLAYSSNNFYSVKSQSNYGLSWRIESGLYASVMLSSSDTEVRSGYIPTLKQTTPLTVGSHTVYFYNDYEDYVNSLPVDLRPPEPTVWDDFYNWFYHVFGFYPRDDSIIGLLRKLFEGDHSEDTEIIFPTLTPIPTPTPTPTPIPVQTIFVPDGNGNTTIIYQYPDPTTGVITQSPYNPNIENNINIDCDCVGDGSNNVNPFRTVSNDPYSMDASLFWADGFGVQMSDNPLSSTDDNQKTLKAVAEEYTSSVEVLSNSFNVFPFKWLELVGLAGGILIIAGLIRTFLGG